MLHNHEESDTDMFSALIWIKFSGNYKKIKSACKLVDDIDSFFNFS